LRSQVILVIDAVSATARGITLTLEEQKLLVTAIVIDTVNLDPSKGRCEALDCQVAALLLSSTGLDQHSLFDDCMKGGFQCSCTPSFIVVAKSDTSSLTVAEFLRRDYKQVAVNQRNIGVSALVGASLKDFFAKVVQLFHHFLFLPLNDIPSGSRHRGLRARLDGEGDARCACIDDGFLGADIHAADVCHIHGP
jgi:hypothetical protein